MLITVNTEDAISRDCDRCDAENRAQAPYVLSDETQLCLRHLKNEWRAAKDPLRRAQLRRLFLP
jgi:hypothetical protein